MPDQSGKLRVFISWSLTLSHSVALVLQDWLPRVIQSVDPWVSSEDIEKGTWWNQSIVEALDSSTVGIVVITPSNLERTWINFEAGALARAIRPATGGIVAPLLIDVPGSSIEGPMGGLQVTRLDKDDFFKLMQAINSKTADPLKDALLAEEFEIKWPMLQASIEDAIADAARESPGHDVKRKQRPEGDILEDLVSAVRELRQEVRGGITNFGAGWPPINEFAVVQEVDHLVSQLGIKVAGVQIVDVHSNGQIFLAVAVDGPITKSDNYAIKRALNRGAPKYAVQVEVSQSSLPSSTTTTSSVGGSRIVAPPSTEDEPGSN